MIGLAVFVAHGITQIEVGLAKSPPFGRLARFRGDELVEKNFSALVAARTGS